MLKTFTWYHCIHHFSIANNYLLDEVHKWETISCNLDILPIIPFEYQTALKKCGKGKHSNCVVYFKPNSPDTKSLVGNCPEGLVN